MTSPIAPSTPRPDAEGPPANLRSLGAPSTEELQDRLFNVVVIVVISIVFFVVGGSWAYSQVGNSLRELRAAGLNALLESETRILLVWIEEKKRDAERWASTPEVQNEAARLARLAAGGSPAAQFCATASQRALLGDDRALCQAGGRGGVQPDGARRHDHRLAARRVLRPARGRRGLPGASRTRVRRQDGVRAPVARGRPRGPTGCGLSAGDGLGGDPGARR